MRLSDPVTSVRGVGARRGELLALLDIHTVEDLLWHMPLRYEDRRRVASASELRPGCRTVFRGMIETARIRPAQSGRNRNLYIATLEIAERGAQASPVVARVVLFGGPRSFGAIEEGRGILLYGEPRFEGQGGKTGDVPEFASPEYAVLKNPDDEPPAGWLRIVPVYPTTAGLSRRKLAEIIYGCATSGELIAYDPLPDELVAKRELPTYRDALRWIHAPEDEGAIAAARARLAYQELYLMQRKVAAARSRRSQVRAENFAKLSGGREAANRFLAGLPFPLTPFQMQVAAEVAADLENPEGIPMYRLLQGDVGSGKTVLALYAAALCAGAGCQAAIMAPTSILCAQLYAACERHLAPIGVRCAMLTGGTKAGERKALLASLARGEVDVLVGTHALIEPDVVFSKLALAVVDEQQRFGVEQRDRFQRKGEGVHLLSMSATPIPRTLSLALYGDMETSQLREKPPGRKAVLTRLLSDNHLGELYRFLRERIAAGERCFWVCPLVDAGETEELSSVVDRAGDAEKRLRGALVGRLHGRMTLEEKSRAMVRFARGETPLLVSTTVIEVGVDVPEANIMIVEGASRFGLSQLHQLRGRVGRGGARGVCILLDSAANISKSEGLSIVAKCDDGFAIAEEDLRLRGAGEIAGVRQHGELAFRVARLPEDLPLLEYARADAGAGRERLS